jgi:hypothetical protein
MNVFWFLMFAALGALVGWELKGLMVERRERDEPPVRPSLYGDVSRTTVDIVGAKADEVDNVLEEFPIARIANDIITQALGALSLVELKKIVSRTWAPYDDLSEHDQFIVLRDVTRRIYGGS